MNNADLKKISLAEAKETYAIHFLPGYLEAVYSEQDLVCIVEEDAHFENLDIDEDFDSQEFVGVLFCKNLSASKNIIQEEMDYGPLVIVLGDVKAQNVYVSGGDIFFRGSVTAEQTLVCGVYNHGVTEIAGELSAEVIISLDHSFDYDDDKIKKGFLVSEALVYSHGNLNEELDLLNEKLYDEDNFNTDLVLAFIKENKSLLRN